MEPRLMAAIDVKAMYEEDLVCSDGPRDRLE